MYKRQDDYQAALAAGFDPADFNMISGRMVEAHKASVAAEEEQQAEETRATERSRIENILDVMKREEPGGGPPIPTSPFGTPEGIPSTLAGYPAGSTFADIEAAVLGLGERAANIAQVGEEANIPNPLESTIASVAPPEGGFRRRAGGGTVRPGEITVVGEKGPEIAMMPPGTHILPLGKATKNDIRAAQSTGRAYQAGGIVFGDLPIGLQQLQRGRPITPSRGYLSQAAGLTLPSAQAMSNITPESRDVFLDLAAQAGIPRKSFAQELASTIPSGRRMPVARIAPISRRGIQ